MIVIVNTSKDSSAVKEIRQSLNAGGINAEIIDAASLKISPCLGCNYCWLKTPGVCAIKDDYEMILKKAVYASQLWLISDTALGFIDHRGKNIIDRIIPITTMNLHFVGKEMRHISRYEKAPDVGLIYIGEADKDYLKRWNERVAVNFESSSLGVYGRDEIKEAVSCMH